MTATSLEVCTQSPKVDVCGLNFYYDKFHALKNISLQILEKQVTVFIGPSGYDKSTLLRAPDRMYTLYPRQCTEGQINMNDENLLTSRTDIALLCARVDMVSQKPASFPMSIHDSIAFGVKLFERLPCSEVDSRVEWALTKIALQNKMKDRLSQSNYGLPGGQQQRLCTAHDIATHPEVLLLDEPYPALNPISTGKIEELIAELEDSYTVVIATHSVQQATCYPDYAAYVYLNELIEFDDTGRIFIKPQRREMGDYTTGHFG